MFVYIYDTIDTRSATPSLFLSLSLSLCASLHTISYHIICIIHINRIFWLPSCWTQTHPLFGENQVPKWDSTTGGWVTPWKMVQSTNQARMVLSNSCDKNGKILVSLTCHQPVLPAFPRRMSSRHSLCLGRSAPRLESGSSGGTKPSAAKARRALGKSMRLVFAPGWRHQSKKTLKSAEQLQKAPKKTPAPPYPFIQSFIPHAARVRAERCPAKTACAHIKRGKKLSLRLCEGHHRD